MVVRLLLFLLPFFLSAQPVLKSVRWVGTGTNERTIDVGMSNISIAFAWNYSSLAGDQHPEFVYFRNDACDDFVGTSPIAGATADSVCFVFPWESAIGVDTTITPKGIKRFTGTSVVVGEYLDYTDSTYIMLLMSDPDNDVIITGTYYGDGTNPRGFNIGIADTLQSFVIFTPLTNTSTNASLCVLDTGVVFGQMLGVRGILGDQVTLNDSGFAVKGTATYRYNDNNNWYAYFGVLPDADNNYYRMLSHYGMADDDTLLFGAPTGFKPTIVLGTGFTGASFWTSAFGTSCVQDTSWRLGTTGIALRYNPEADFKAVVDTFIIWDGGNLDVTNLTSKVIFLGDTLPAPACAGYIDGGGTTPSSTRRQPCEGNIKIENKEGVIWQEKYK